eukprot:scaffold16257_cov25-Phaeocystis_antarctica.AAC.2
MLAAALPTLLGGALLALDEEGVVGGVAVVVARAKRRLELGCELQSLFRQPSGAAAQLAHVGHVE